MKAIVFILCSFLVFSCNKKIEEVTPLEKPTLKGAWELVSFLNYNEDGTADTIKSSNDYRQIKMYSETKIMWSRLRAWDSLDWFGVGDYTFKDSVLSESLDYGSKAMASRINEKKPFVFKILIDENNFTQIEIDSLGNPIIAEIYKRIE